MAALKVTKTQEPFTSSRTAASIQGAEVIKFENGGSKVVVKGSLKNEDGDEELCIVELNLQSTLSSPEVLLSNLPKMSLNLTNYSGAEYSYYDCEFLGSSYACEVIWPATQTQLKRKLPTEWFIFEESVESYQQVALNYALEQQAHLGWVDKVCSLEKEKDRNLFANKSFVINIDTKWTTHPTPALGRVDLNQQNNSASTNGDVGTFENEAPPSFVIDRSTWYQASWTDSLYLLAISCDKNLKSLRDLKGLEGRDLCLEMQSELERVALEVYGVPSSKLRIFFHYHPQFYRLHAHCTRIEHCNPGCETDRAHLLKTVASNLDLKPDYYSAYAPIQYKLRVGETLYNKFVEANYITV